MIRIQARWCQSVPLTSHPWCSSTGPGPRYGWRARYVKPLPSWNISFAVSFPGPFGSAWCLGSSGRKQRESCQSLQLCGHSFGHFSFWASLSTSPWIQEPISSDLRSPEFKMHHFFSNITIGKLKMLLNYMQFSHYLKILHFLKELFETYLNIVSFFKSYIPLISTQKRKYSCNMLAEVVLKCLHISGSDLL